MTALKNQTDGEVKDLGIKYKEIKEKFTEANDRYDEALLEADEDTINELLELSSNLRRLLDDCSAQLRGKNFFAKNLGEQIKTLQFYLANFLERENKRKAEKEEKKKEKDRLKRLKKEEEDQLRLKEQSVLLKSIEVPEHLIEIAQDLNEAAAEKVVVREEEIDEFRLYSMDKSCYYPCTREEYISLKDKPMKAVRIFSKQNKLDENKWVKVIIEK